MKNLPASRRPRFYSWVRKIPWRKAWQPSPVFLPGESHGQRNQAGYSPWGHRVEHNNDHAQHIYQSNHYNPSAFLPTSRTWFIIMDWPSLIALVAKNLHASAGDVRRMDLIPGSGRSPGGGNGNPLQSSCLENPMDRGAWWATVCGMAKSQTHRSDLACMLFTCAFPLPSPPLKFERWTTLFHHFNSMSLVLTGWNKYSILKTKIIS